MTTLVVTAAQILADVYAAPAPPSWHGTSNGYRHRACRCPDCREWAAQYSRAQRARGAPDSAVHGALSTYTNYACRCEPCLAAGRAYRQTLRNTATPVAINGAGDREGSGSDRGASPG